MNARALPLAAAIAAALLGPACGVAATLPVTSCADDGSPGTLRSVVDSAVDGDTVDMTQLACSTITLTQGAIDVTPLGPNPLHDLTILGPGQAALTVSGDQRSAVFLLGGPSAFYGGTFLLSDFTIAHGAKYDAAACVASFSGDLVLDRVTVTDCHSLQANYMQGGGAVSSYYLTLTDSTISDSSVTAIGQGVATGGGIWAKFATVTGSTISGNSANAEGQANYSFRYQTSGGGIYAGRSLTLTDSTVSNNHAEATAVGEDANGGGIAARGFVTVTGSTLSGNSADGTGGGLFAGFTVYQYALVSDPDWVIRNTTVTGNSAELGGGIAFELDATLSNSTIAFNESTYGGAVAAIPFFASRGGSSSLFLDSAIIASNSAGPTAQHVADLAASSSVTLNVVGANNLIGTADAAIALPADTLHNDPQLLPLAWNGGPTQTLALDSGSPAIDTGNDVANLATDQRGEGFVRVYGAYADIGAFEVQPMPDPIFASGFDP
ncbi:MAG: choice-of-anchor Q domain-containing protein [Lysobacterales bacterium]